MACELYLNKAVFKKKPQNCTPKKDKGATRTFKNSLKKDKSQKYKNSTKRALLNIFRTKS